MPPDTAETVAPAVASRLTDSARRSGSLLCVGIDPRPELLPDRLTLTQFLSVAVEAFRDTSHFPAAFKPNVAYFHRLDQPRIGSFAGSRALAGLMDNLDELYPEVPLILDAKRGDIGESSRAYAEETFLSWNATAVTVSPFMGADSVAPFLELAALRHGWVYLLNRTSNPGATTFQDPPHLARTIQEWQKTYGSAGAVIGATAPGELRALLGVHNENPIPILIPGVGAQGGTTAETITAIRESEYLGELVRVNLSRRLLFPWSSEGSVPEGVSATRRRLKESFLRLWEELRWG